MVVFWKDKRLRLKRPRWQVPQVIGMSELGILDTHFTLMSSVMVYIRRAAAFSGFVSSAKLSRGRPLGPMFLGSSVWQVAAMRA